MSARVMTWLAISLGTAGQVSPQSPFYSAIRRAGSENDGQTSVIYNALTGEVGVEPPGGQEFTSVNIDSKAGIFHCDPAPDIFLGGFSNCIAENLFTASFGGGIGEINFGLRPSLSEEFLLNDLTVIGSLVGGGDLGRVDLVYIPPPEFVPTVDEVLKLTWDDQVSELFGLAVDVNGDEVIVGAEGIGRANQPDPGAAYLFDVTEAGRPLKWTGGTVGINDEFGRSVAISGTAAIVGAAGDDDVGEDAGSAFLFDVKTDQMLYKLTASDLPGSRFGTIVDIDSRNAIVGAPGEGGGTAYVFDVASGRELFRLAADDVGSHDEFGAAVGISGDVAIVGAPRHGNTGAAYLFSLSTGQQLFKLNGDNAPGSFGHAVAIDGSRAIVGTNRESAYLFNVRSGHQLFELVGPRNPDRFGRDVDIDGDLAVVGSNNDVAYVFDIRTGHLVLGLTPEDLPPTDLFGHAVGIDGNRVVVGAEFEEAVYVYTLTLPLRLVAGDADQDLDFDQFDLVQVLTAGKYLTGQPATWGEGDWDGAPGGSPGDPPAGDGIFDQRDIVAALQTNTYLTEPFPAIRKGGARGDEQTSIVYDARTGEIAVDAPASRELTSINIDSAAGVFANRPVPYDVDPRYNIYKATFGSSFGSVSFGNVAQPGLSEDFIANDLSVIGSLWGGGGLGEVDLIYIPEPSAVVLLAFGLLAVAVHMTHRDSAVRREKWAK